LFAGGAVDAGVRHRALPFPKKGVLFGQARESASLQRIGLRIFDSRLDLSLGVGCELHLMEVHKNST
jgi:hypothetical protein